MATEIKDRATAEEAALNLNKAPEAPKPGEPVPPRKSTSAVLFPDFITDDGGIVNRPLKDLANPPAPATPPAPASAAPAPAMPAPTPPGYLDLSKLPENTMVRTKVDGVEMDVPVKEYLKGIQLERHLTLQSQKLAEDRKALEAERASLRQPPPATPPAPGTPPAASKPPAAPPSGEASRIAQLEADIASLRAAVAPQQFQTGVKKLADRAKTEFGVDDFNTYLPQIQKLVDSELARPEIQANPAELRKLDSQEFWYAQYKDMKLRDLLAGKTTPPAMPAPSPSAPAVVPIVIPAGTVPVIDKNGAIVPIPVIEGSGGVPSRTAPDADWQARYSAAFAKAKETGSNSDWQEVFRLKREVPAGN